MVASETRLNARKSLTGKWGKAAIASLVYVLIMFVLELALSFIPVLGPIIATVISIPLAYGLIVNFMNLKRGEAIKYTQFFTDGFNAFGKVWLVTLRMLLKLLVPIILIIVSYILMFIGFGSALYGAVTLSSSTAPLVSSFGVLSVFLGFIMLIASSILATVKFYLYVLSFYILKDNPDMEAKAIVEESERLMKGNRMSFFWLQLTFIGWAILASITFGIGYLWLLPYITVSQVEFYEKLAGKTTDKIKSEPESTDDGNAIKEV